MCAMVRRTFKWLQDLGRPPNEYEEITVHINWWEPFHYDRAWPRELRSKVKCSNWELFRDPSKLTYRNYNRVQNEKEQQANTIFQSAERVKAIEKFDPMWVETLRHYYPILLYAENTLSKVHQFVTRFAESGLISNCSMFQAFDEIRHVQLLLFWVTALAEKHDPGFSNHKEKWLRDPVAQPLREYSERLLTIEDWVEAVVASDVVLESIMQPFLLETMSDVAQSNDDLFTPNLNFSQLGDEQRHISWSHALVSMLVAEGQQNQTIIQEWVNKWFPYAQNVFNSIGHVLSIPKIHTFSIDEARDKHVNEDWANSLVKIGLATPAGL